MGVVSPVGGRVQVMVDTVSAGRESIECPDRGKLPMTSGGLTHLRLICHSCIAAVLGPMGVGVCGCGCVCGCVSLQWQSCGYC